MSEMTPLGIPMHVLEELNFGLKWGAFEQPVGHRVKRALRAGIFDDVIVQLLFSLTRPFRVRELLGELAPFARPALQRGRLRVQGLDNRDLFWSHDILPQNVLSCSRPGGGKSLMTQHFALQIAELPVAQWLSDNYKKKLRHLRPLFADAGKDLVILQPKNWRFNLFQAGPRDPRAHLNMSLDLLERVAGFQERGRSIVRQISHELYREFGIFDGATQAYPTLNHLFQKIRKMQGLNDAAKNSVLDRLAALIPELGQPYLKGWDPTELAEHSIVFEMIGTTEDSKHLFTVAQLFGILNHTYASGAGNRGLKLVVCFDDAQRIATQQSGSAQMPTLSEYLSVNRGADIGIWLNIQSMDGISKGLTAACGTKFMGTLGSHSDFMTLGPDMGLNREQIEWAKLNLTPGTFIAQIADPTWRQPFPFRIPKPSIPDTVDDQEAEDSVKILNQIPTVKATGFEDWTPFQVIDITRTDEPNRSKLTDQEMRFLKAVVSQPDQPSGVYARKAGVNGKRAAEIRKAFIDAGYIRERDVATAAGPGRTSIILEPLAPALEVVDHTNHQGTA